MTDKERYARFGDLLRIIVDLQQDTLEAISQLGALGYAVPTAYTDIRILDRDRRDRWVWWVNGEALRAMTPPSCFEPIHEHMVEATHHFDKASPLFASGVEDLDSSKLEQAAAEMMLGQKEVIQATAEMDELQRMLHSRGRTVRLIRLRRKMLKRLRDALLAQVRNIGSAVGPWRKQQGGC